MQFIIVADDTLAPLGRQIAHTLSNQKTNSGAFWSVKHYKDNEAQLDGKQPVIFLGDHELTQSYVDVLPERFCGYGVRCHYEGSKVVLVAETPTTVSLEDLKELQAVIDKSREEHSQRAEAAKSDDAKFIIVEEAEITAAMAFSIGSLMLFGPVGIGLVGLAGLGWTAKKYIGDGNVESQHIKQKYEHFTSLFFGKHRKEYATLQYSYLLTRFLLDEFDAYVTGIEGR